MNQISFVGFAHHASHGRFVQQGSPGGVNPKPVGGPSGAGGLPVCTSKKPRRKPRPVDQLPLPFQAYGAARPVIDRHVRNYRQSWRDLSIAALYVIGYRA